MTCRMCGGCKRDIGYGNYLGCMGTFFHPECFCCRACGYPITEHEVINILFPSPDLFFLLISIFFPYLTCTVSVDF